MTTERRKERDQTSQDRHLSFDHLTKGIATSLGIGHQQVCVTVELLEAGNTIPFIARYRKEATQGLDETTLRSIEDSHAKARQLANRKAMVLKTIEQHGKLNSDLRQQIELCSDKSTLENLYLPFKPKRRTRATVARERGLLPLAETLLHQETLGRSKDEVLDEFVDPEMEVPDRATALQSACDIVAEHWSEVAQTRSWMLAQAKEFGEIVCRVKRGKKEAARKFESYFDHREPVKRIPSHRLLAMKRGVADGLLHIGLFLRDDVCLSTLKPKMAHNPAFEFHRELLQTVEDCYQRLLLPATESSVLKDLKDAADEEAIRVFATNLRELLLAPPAGPLVTMGIDPGFRTGCKVAVVDGTGKFLDHTTIFPTPPRNDTAEAEAKILEMIDKFTVKLIAIGNGTASRETDAFVTQLLLQNSLDVTKATVSESGASIYSASELAIREYPHLDVTIRGAISIAHRLQDPLAELVKIDPKSIGVGQYQHDVNQMMLKKSLVQQVESCVNSVGVDVNMASSLLLAHVAGIGPKLAESVVKYRDQHGRFHNRQQLCDIPNLGEKAYQQAAGFLRIRDGDDPLDNSAVHPESYYVVKQMAAKLNVSTHQLVDNVALVEKLKAEDFVDDQCGLPTVNDILAELAKPGRDPRNDFQVAKFNDKINALDDLKEGMILEGVITNVTQFGAFVDLGVHQDGLIHISQLSSNYVRDPSEVVAIGNVVRVKVLEVDLERHRVALSKKEVSG